MEFFFFSSRRRHTRSDRDWSSDVCSSDLFVDEFGVQAGAADGFGDSFRAQVDGGEAGESALKFSDGSADGGENYGRFHGRPPWQTTLYRMREAGASLRKKQRHNTE